MKFNIPVSTFQYLISMVKDFSVPQNDKGTVLTCLTQVLLKVVGGNLTCQCTNLEIGMSASAPCEDEEDGSIAVPVIQLSQFLGTIDKGTLLRVVKDKKKMSLSVETGKTKIGFKGLDPEEFPPFMTTGATNFEVPANLLALMLKSTMICAAPDDARPTLNGILIQTFNNKMGIEFVATDGYRLAHRTMDNRGLSDSKHILPLSSAKKIVKYLKSGIVSVGETVSGDAMTFHGDNWTIVSQCIQGEYPEWNNVMSTFRALTLNVVAVTKDVLNAVSTCNVIAREENNTLEISMDTGDVEEKNDMVFYTDATDVGMALRSFPVEGRVDNFKVNSVFLKDIIQEIGSDHVKIFFGGSGKGCRIVPPDRNDQEYMIACLTSNKEVEEHRDVAAKVLAAKAEEA